MDSHLSFNQNPDDIYDDVAGEWYLPEDEEGELSGDKFNYHFVFGNEKIVFIKAGAGGSERGYGDKYIKMAERIHERTGATVITASNPMEPICDAPDAEEIRRVVKKMGFECFELFLIGASDGAYPNLELASQFPETKKWTGINTSFVSIHDLEARLKSIPNVTKLMIYGSKDDDFVENAPMLNQISCNNLVLNIVEGADHSFTDMLDEFIALADYI